MTVKFPAMRREVARALASLADPQYTYRAWVAQEPLNPGSFEDLTLIVNILYDDMEVLPDPSSQVGTVLHTGDEVTALEQLAGPLGRALDRLGDAPDIVYLESPEWPDVARAAGIALAAMVRGGECTWPQPEEDADGSP